MASQFSVCIVIPNYNYGRFICSAIRSAAAQDYSTMHLIVVDDGSKDDSLKQIDVALASSREVFRTVQVLQRADNAGKLAALNMALQYVTADITVILDSDDQLMPTYLSRTLEALRVARERDASVAFIYTDSQLIDDDATVLSVGRSRPFDQMVLRTSSYIPECAPVLTAALREVLPFDESVRVGTKHQKWLRIVSNGWTGVHLAEPLFQYRMHDRNLSGIGQRVLREIANGERSEKILSGYWPVQRPA
jgi:glycosyltransferase involved in cell wall biosynthesis